jgi:hypothetical protein
MVQNVTDAGFLNKSSNLAPTFELSSNLSCNSMVFVSHDFSHSVVMF